MRVSQVIRRFLVPSFIVTLLAAMRWRCFISPRAEVELSENLSIAKGTQISSFTKIKSAGGPLTIGTNVSIGASCFISSDRGGIEIGDDALISPLVAIVGGNYRYDRLDVPIRAQGTVSKGIRIGQNVWIGTGAVILDGAYIGDGAIIAASSVVAGRLPANSVAEGNPATVIFTRR